MSFVRGGIDGERIEMSRPIKRRLRDAEALAIRDLMMAEWSLRGRTQAAIGMLMRCDQSFVSLRLATIPHPMEAALAALVRAHAEHIPDEARERFTAALVEHREREREERRRRRHAGRGRRGAGSLDRRARLPAAVD